MKFMQSRSKNQRLKQHSFQPAERISQIPPIASHLVFISDQKPMTGLVEQKLKPQILTKGRMIQNIAKQLTVRCAAISKPQNYPNFIHQKHSKNIFSFSNFNELYSVHKSS